jgi:hypothetical protein
MTCAIRSSLIRPSEFTVVCSASSTCNPKIQEHQILQEVKELQEFQELQELHGLAHFALFYFDWSNISSTRIKNQSEAPAENKPKAKVLAKSKPKALAEKKPKALAKSKPKTKVPPTKARKLAGKAARAEVLRIGATANTIIEVYPQKGVAKKERWFMRVVNGKVIWRKSKPFITECLWCLPNSWELDKSYPHPRPCPVEWVKECHM